MQSNTFCLASMRVLQVRRRIRSRLSRLKKLSATTLPWQLPQSGHEVFPVASPEDRHPTDVLIIVLQALYSLSDDQAEFQIQDRLFFMRFLGLGLGDRVPMPRRFGCSASTSPRLVRSRTCEPGSNRNHSKAEKLDVPWRGSPETETMYRTFMSVSDRVRGRPQRTRLPPEIRCKDVFLERDVLKEHYFGDYHIREGVIRGTARH